MIYSNIDLIRGDDCFIPVLATIPTGSTVNIHLREYPDSEYYQLLSIVDNSVYIPAAITINLSGHYEFDIEISLDNVVTTIQHTNLDFIKDVTRTYGDIEPILNADLERNKIIAKEYLIKDNQGNVTNLGNVNYRHVQSIASNIWNIQHNLLKYPSIVVTDTAGTVIEGTIKYIDNNNITAEFNIEFSGYANVN